MNCTPCSENDTTNIRRYVASLKTVPPLSKTPHCRTYRLLCEWGIMCDNMANMFYWQYIPSDQISSSHVLLLKPNNTWQYFISDTISLYFINTEIQICFITQVVKVFYFISYYWECPYIVINFTTFEDHCTFSTSSSPLSSGRRMFSISCAVN